MGQLTLIVGMVKVSPGFGQERATQHILKLVSYIFFPSYHGGV
jgi:hypothetical protein